MGLDFTLSNAHWSYRSFMMFRRRLAEEVCINLDEMAGFTENGKPWPDDDDPIYILLSHSDCDGDIDAEDCAAVGKRLLELVSAWPVCDFDRKQAEELGRDLVKCGESGAAMGFC